MGLVLSLLLVSWVPRVQIDNGRVVIDAAALESRPVTYLHGPWRYRADSGDDSVAWASPMLDDTDWALVNPVMPNGAPDGWQGAGWFRMRMVLPNEWVNRPMALWFVRIGETEVFVDGERIEAFGEPRLGENELAQVSFAPAAFPVTFRRSEVVVAFRLAAPNRMLDFISSNEGTCAVGVGLASSIPAERKDNIDVIRRYRFFIGVSFALGLLHLLLFVFLPERKENLQYALATFAVCGLSYFVETRVTPTSIDYFLTATMLFKVCIIALVLFGVKFFYAILGDPPTVLFKAYVIVGVVLALAVNWVPVTAIYVYAVYGVFEQIRLTLVANVRGLRDAWLLAIGVMLSGVSALFQMVPELLDTQMPVRHAYLYGYLGMLVMMSAYQARGFARTYRDLRQRLDDVRRLSEERVEQARRVRSEEMERVRLEEENKRQAVELQEAARRKEMFLQLEAANRELQETQAQLVQSEKMASLGQLVAGIAHEINTPVGAIRSMHDSLSKATARLKDALHTEDARFIEQNRRVKASLKVIDDATEVIESGSGRVAKIVRRLKSFARLDEAELLRADVHEGLDDTLVLLHHELKRNVRVHLDYGEVPPFPCFPSQLNQVFLNLLVNARQAIDGQGEIFVTTRVVDGQAHISIRDTGVGIPPENIAKIFDPGFTTKGVKVGTGLGLSICYRIVKEHRGEIRVDSTVGEGSTFTVVLPMDLDQQIDGAPS